MENLVWVAVAARSPILQVSFSKTKKIIPLEQLPPPAKTIVEQSNLSSAHSLGILMLHPRLATLKCINIVGLVGAQYISMTE